MWARFFLVRSRTDLRLKMGLLGVLLGVCQVWCRNSHFQWSKLDLETPQFEIFFRNWDFAQSHGAFFSSWVQMVLGGSIIIFRHFWGYFEILVPKFAFLVVKIYLETPQFEIFQKLGLYKIWAHFFLVGSRMDLRLKMGLLGVLLGVCHVWCRNSHFQWSKLDLENPPI